ncbi:uncharacterized protein LOC111065350 isoform X2 [Drosophila obscura]|uniref:uncharacterized protein LOC111065350 isoform X2 n=1 Tax=Drosophila obscura TaxID=7282 RepID=UPI000BA09EF1|nr:uncharacterized protein LOC111065350 isoform X2 [Drosophila obscura]
MHRRKTAKSINKPPPIQGPAKKVAVAAPDATAPAFDGESAIQFELELCWCVQQLQTALDGGKLSQKVAEDTAKNLKILTSQTAPLIKKRQVMKLSMGDYRSKMQQEERKLMLASKQIKFTPSADTNKKSSFVKKSALLTSGKDFRFEFALPTATDTNETTQEPAQETASHPQSDLSTLRSSLQQESTGSQFKFNFTIEEEHANDINFSGLRLNS